MSFEGSCMSASELPRDHEFIETSSMETSFSDDILTLRNAE